jgi:outer membrane PBP1 activator LpoA protein
MNIYIVIFLAFFGLTSCSSGSMPSFQGLNPFTGFGKQTSTTDIYSSALWQGNTDIIWDRLQHISKSRLETAQNNINDPDKKAWIQLAIISKQNSTDTVALVHHILAWRAASPNHPANALLPDNTVLNGLLTSASPHHIVLLLPLKGSYGSSGKAVREGFLNAYYANSSKVGKQNLTFTDTSAVSNVANAYQLALSQGADFVIGPLEKENVQQLSSVGTFNAPTLALNYTNISFGSLPNNFYEYGLLPEDEAQQVANRAHDAGLSRAIVIAPQDAWGTRMVSSFSSQWQSSGGRIQDTLYFTPQTNFSTDIAQLLHVNQNDDKKLMQDDNNKSVLEKQRRQDFDVVFVFAKPAQAGLIVPLLRYYYVNKTPIYATSSVYSGNQTRDVDLNGVTICDIPSSGGDVSSRRLYALGQDTYLLSQNLARMTALPNFPIYGKTGALTLSSQHQIHRRLPCMVIHNGRL